MKENLIRSAAIALGLVIGDLLYGIRDPKQLAFKAVFSYVIVFVGLSVFNAVRAGRE